MKHLPFNKFVTKPARKSSRPLPAISSYAPGRSISSGFAWAAHRNVLAHFQAVVALEGHSFLQAVRDGERVGGDVGDLVNRDWREHVVAPAGVASDGP